MANPSQVSSMDFPFISRVLIYVGVAFLLVYDMAMLLWIGEEATLSKVTLEASCKYPILPLAVGILIGHLFW